MKNKISKENKTKISQNNINEEDLNVNEEETIVKVIIFFISIAFFDIIMKYFLTFDNFYKLRADINSFKIQLDRFSSEIRMFNKINHKNTFSDERNNQKPLFIKTTDFIESKKILGITNSIINSCRNLKLCVAKTHNDSFDEINQSFKELMRYLNGTLNILNSEMNLYSVKMKSFNNKKIEKLEFVTKNIFKCLKNINFCGIDPFVLKKTGESMFNTTNASVKFIKNIKKAKRVV